MKSYRIVLEYTDDQIVTNGNHQDDPSWWDWYNLLNLTSREAVSVVHVEEIETPVGHTEELANA